MSTRQLRLNTEAQIRKRLKEFRGSKINIVLRDNTVLLGDLLNADETFVSVKNMRLKTHNILLKDISEIYFDTKE
jgi:urease accessory protein UreE